jgi:hypothetical protein
MVQKGDGQAFHIELQSEKVLWEMIHKPDPGLEEAFMDEAGRCCRFRKGI